MKGEHVRLAPLVAIVISVSRSGTFLDLDSLPGPTGNVVIARGQMEQVGRERGSVVAILVRQRSRLFL